LFAGCAGVTNIEHVADIVRYLKTLPANLLIDDGGPEFLFMPVIDGVEMISHPLKLVNGPDGNRLVSGVDLMVGSCTNEGFVNAKEAVKNWQLRHGIGEEREAMMHLNRHMARQIVSTDLRR